MHLFAGVGGGLLADRILGHDPIIAVEWDRYACQVLRERAADGWFPNLSVWEGDVRLFNPSEYANRVDCIHAGFPCQDLSVAGNQAGLGEGTRSGLYREVLRIAGIVKPRQIFLENVSAILSNGLGTVLADLAAMGYDSRWICLRASDVGAPHHRDRWWGLCTHADLQYGQRRSESQQPNSDSGTAWIEPKGLCGNVRNTKHAGRNAAEVTGSSTQGSDGNEARAEQASEPTRPSDAEVLAYAGHAGICQRGQFGYAQSDVRHGSGIFCDGLSSSCNQEGKVLADSYSAQREREQLTLRGFEEYPYPGGGSWWQLESDVGRVANGIPNRVDKLKGLGNAQVPIQCATAWKLLGGE